MKKPVRKTAGKTTIVVTKAVKPDLKGKQLLLTNDSENAERESYEFNYNALEIAAAVRPSEFKSQMFNDHFMKYVNVFSQASDSHTAYVVATLHACISSLLSGLYLIRPDKGNPSFTISPNLSGLLIGNSGVKKSPALNAITNAIYAREDQIAVLAEEELIKLNRKSELVRRRNNTISQEINKLERAKLRHEDNDHLKAKDLEKEIANLSSKIEDVSQNKFTTRKLVVGSPTLMGLVSILSQQSTPLMLVKDEISDLVCNILSPIGDSQRALFMVLMDGQGTESYERANKEAIKLTERSISIIGTAQPERLNSLITNIHNGKVPNDGFLSRFSLIVYPNTRDSLKNSELLNSAELSESIKKWEALVAELDIHNPVASIEAISRKTVCFTPQALAAYNKFRCENRIQKDQLHSLYQSLLSKQESIVASLALINAVFRRNSISEFQGNIKENDVKMAIQQVKVYESHFAYFFKLKREESYLALTLLNKIKSSKFDNTDFTVSQIYKQDWSQFKTKESVESALNRLEELQLASVRHPMKRQDGGRPTIYWSLVTPN